ncbi:hypothetical protein, partial [Streptomyces sp. PU_AKi4]|uniref:hypothetical protein n=1 Tax=Streptomyces sp. PU_AKi4 TaxID=2800809 RepID=UPI003526017E
MTWYLPIITIYIQVTFAELHFRLYQIASRFFDKFDANSDLHLQHTYLHRQYNPNFVADIQLA